MKQIKDFTFRIVAGANVAAIVLMAVVGYSDRINPVDHQFWGVLGLCFPAVLAVNIAFMVFWLCTRKRWALLPFIGLVVCYQPVTTYCALNVGRDVPDGAIKVLTFNVFQYHEWTPENPDPAVVRYILKQNADIVCLEEAELREDMQPQLDSLMASYAYHDTTLSHTGGDRITIYSRFPIIGKESIEYESVNNHSASFWLNIHGDSVAVIVNHLESICLTDEDKSDFKSLVKGDFDREKAADESRTLYHKLGETTSRRAPQADSVAAYVSRQLERGRSIILCGDFNDSPISYCHYRLASLLDDCFVRAGNGLGISYHRDGFYVRIDHIMCSHDWQPYRCKVDRTTDVSDHYPVLCWLKKKKK